MTIEGLDKRTVIEDVGVGTGRLYIPDERDWPLRSEDLQAEAPEAQESLDKGWRYWFADGWWGDQGRTPQCVAYSWLHWAEDGPVTHEPKKPQRGDQHDRGSLHNPTEMYNWCQRNDQWPGEDYDGTSVRAGAKYLQSKGMIAQYRWAQNIDDITRAVLTQGPVIMGTLWTRSMSRPDENNFIHVGNTEGDLYGHAYLVNGVNLEKNKARIKNSWGRSWGKNGHAWIALDELERLLNNHGEACLAIENPSD